MREGIYVNNYKKCARCNGSGVVTNPRWARVFAREASGIDLDTAIDQEFGSLRSRDISSTPEENDCGDCEGTGYNVELITLKEALDIIMPSAGSVK